MRDRRLVGAENLVIRQIPGDADEIHRGDHGDAQEQDRRQSKEIPDKSDHIEATARLSLGARTPSHDYGAFAR